jgi:hypothetical protein
MNVRASRSSAIRAAESPPLTLRGGRANTPALFKVVVRAVAGERPQRKSITVDGGFVASGNESHCAFRCRYGQISGISESKVADSD